MLEKAWDESRIDLVRTALYISTCEGHNLFYCDILKTERDFMLKRGLPEKIDEGSAGTYKRAASNADVLVMNIENAIEQSGYYINELYENGIDEDLAEIIEATVRETRSSRASLRLADMELIADPENTAMREAREHLESAYAEYEIEDLPTDWGIEDVEAALKDLEDARRVLDEQIFLD